jgi:hypothetical protein
VPDEDEEGYLEVDLSEFEEVEVEPLDPRDPDYLVSSGKVDPDVDEMVNRLFGDSPAQKSREPHVEDETPTERPPPPEIEDPDEEEFRAFMNGVYGKTRPT